jgi:hypothetical protein
MFVRQQLQGDLWTSSYRLWCRSVPASCDPAKRTSEDAASS